MPYIMPSPYRGPGGGGSNPFEGLGEAIESGWNFVAPVARPVLVTFLVTAVAVGLQLGIQGALASIFEGMAEPLAESTASLISALFEGALSGLAAHFYLGGVTLDETAKERVRGVTTAAFTGAVIGLSIGAIVLASGGSGGEGAGDPPAEFLGASVAVGIVLMATAIVGAIVFALANRGLAAMGLQVAAEYTKNAGERLVDKCAPKFLKQRWEPTHDEKKDNALTVVRGLAKGTGWLTRIRRTDSDALLRGLFVGMVAGAAVVDFETMMKMSNYNFFWQVMVELGAGVVGTIGGGFLLGFLVALFRHTLRLMVELLALAAFCALLYGVVQACHSN